MTITKKRKGTGSLSHKRVVNLFGVSLNKRKKWSKIAKRQREYET